MRAARIIGLMLPLAGFACAGAVEAQSLRLIGQSDLGGGGLNGDIAIVGATAIVGTGILPAAGVHAHLYNPYPCPAGTVKLVSLADPSAPMVVGRIPVPAGVAAHGVAAAHVRTPTFTGDLAAVALAACGAGGGTVERGVAYYDITNPAAPRFLGRYQADADSVRPDSVPPCGPAPTGRGDRCAASQHSVSLVQRADGRVLSMSLEPGASASKFPSGDLRVVDATDPKHPHQVAAFPPPGEPIFSTNGCRPFRAGHGAGFAHNGTRGLLAFYDGGLFVLDLTAPEGLTKLGQFKYPSDRAFEGSAAYVTSATVSGRDLALISEADFIAPSTTLQVRGPAAVTGTKFACEAIFTIFDPQNRAALYRHPGYRVQAQLAYVGRGCPVSQGMGDMHSDVATAHPDPFLSDPAGRIAIVDRSAQPIQTGLAEGSGCSVADRVRRAQEAGAIGVVVAQTSKAAPEAFSPDGDPKGLRIPAIQIDKSDADALRSALCPSIGGEGHCVGGARIAAAMLDAPGEWGALRVVDITNPAEPREIGVYRPASARVFPPPDLGVLSPQRPAVRGSIAFVPWNSGGVRALDLSSGNPREIGSFVPPDVADPTGVQPSKAFVVSVALLNGAPRPGSGTAPMYVVISDVNSGLYVLEAPISPSDSRPQALR